MQNHLSGYIAWAKTHNCPFRQLGILKEIVTDRPAKAIIDVNFESVRYKFTLKGRNNSDQTQRTEMPKSKEEKPFVIRCPNCKQVREPDFNETTRRYVCAICAAPVDAQVLIEKKKRGIR